MNLVLKKGNQYFLVYWIEVTENSIQGMYQLPFLTSFTDIHFTYPQDGNLHYSYKNEHLKTYITTYGTHFKIKMFDDSKDKMFSEEFSRRTHSHQLLDLLPQNFDKPKNLAEYKKPSQCFLFPTTGFPPKNVYNLPNRKSLNKHDVIVDISNYDTGAINFSAFICSRDFQIHDDIFTEKRHLLLNSIDRTTFPNMGFLGVWIK